METAYYLKNISLIKSKLNLQTGQVWGYLEIFKQLDCPECFCEDPVIRKELKTVSAVTKDYLKVFKILNHKTVMSETPEEVSRIVALESVRYLLRENENDRHACY